MGIFLKEVVFNMTSLVNFYFFYFVDSGGNCCDIYGGHSNVIKLELLNEGNFLSGQVLGLIIVLVPWCAP
jgi:hypothetical protein